MSKTIVKTDKAPAAVGPYSQAVKSGNLVYTSGQLGLVPATGEIAEGGVEGQAHQSLKNLGETLKAAGSGYDKVIRTLIFLKDMNDFAKVNAIYATYFAEPYPARSCVEVARLPKDGLIEIECIAEC